MNRAAPVFWSMNGTGASLVSVTVRAASSASTVTPGGTYSPSNGDWLAGSATNEKLSATAVAVNGVPSAQVTPSLSVYVTLVGVSSQLSAKPGVISPSASR